MYLLLFGILTLIYWSFLNFSALDQPNKSSWDMWVLWLTNTSVAAYKGVMTTQEALSPSQRIDSLMTPIFVIIFYFCKTYDKRILLALDLWFWYFYQGNFLSKSFWAFYSFFVLCYKKNRPYFEMGRKEKATERWASIWFRNFVIYWFCLYCIII